MTQLLPIASFRLNVSKCQLIMCGGLGCARLSAVLASYGSLFVSGFLSAQVRPRTSGSRSCLDCWRAFTKLANSD
eukprot:1097398-Pyramimonas_sp.AAC.1